MSPAHPPVKCFFSKDINVYSSCGRIFEAEFALKVHKIENFFDSDFGICVISLIVMSKY